MNTNQVQSHESAGQRRHLSIKESKVFKLDPWLDRVKKKQMCSPEINSEAARIKVLDVERQYRYINSKEAYLADFQVHQGDVLRMIDRDRRIAEENLESPVSRKGMFLNLRSNEKRRELLDTRQKSLNDSPLFKRDRVSLY